MTGSLPRVHLISGGKLLRRNAVSVWGLRGTCTREERTHFIIPPTFMSERMS